MNKLATMVLVPHLLRFVPRDVIDPRARRRTITAEEDYN